jgi:hypothetical protein
MKIHLSEPLDKSSIHEYISSLVAKANQHKEKLLSGVGPYIGIYWLHSKDGQIKIFHSIPEPKEFGQDYGDFIISSKEHYIIWNSLVLNGYAPKSSEYTDLPRGRIAFDKTTSEFVIFHGNWISSAPNIKSVITSEFKLKSNVRYEPDLHYHDHKRWGF